MVAVVLSRFTYKLWLQSGGSGLDILWTWKYSSWFRRGIWVERAGEGGGLIGDVDCFCVNINSMCIHNINNSVKWNI